MGLKPFSTSCFTRPIWPGRATPCSWQVKLLLLAPEDGGNVFPVVIQPLVGGGGVQGAERLYVRADFDIVEVVPVVLLDAVAAGVECGFYAGMGGADIVCKGIESRAVFALAKEEEAVCAEVVCYQFVYLYRRELFSDVLPKEGGVAARAITPAVGDFHCQGNAMGYFLDDDVRQLGDELKHPWGCSSVSLPLPGEARRSWRPS